MKKLKCPKCGSLDVLYEEEWKSEIWNNWDVHKFWRGHCMKCKTLLKWDEKYIFDEYSKIEIDE